jgi:hypothetical protein
MDGESNGFLPGERIFACKKENAFVDISPGSGNLKIE